MISPHQSCGQSHCSHTVSSPMEVTDGAGLHSSDLSEVSDSDGYCHLVNALPVGVFCTDASGKCLSVSDRWCEITGTAALEVVGQGWMEMVHPDDRDRVEREWRQTLHASLPFHAEYRLCTQGQTTWVIGQMTPQVDATGTLVSYIGTLTNTSKPKPQIADHPFSRREQELTDFVENGAIGLHWVGADGTILWANSAELRLLGYQHEEYIGHHIAEFHADATTIADILRRLSANETLHNYEARLLCKDGSIRDVLIDSNVFWERGEFVHTRCFTRDVTAQKQAQRQVEQYQQELEAKVAERTAELTHINQQLQQEIYQHQTTAGELQTSHSLLRTVIDHIPDHIFLKDVAGRFVLVNAALANTLQQPVEKLLGKHSDEVFAPEVARRFRTKDLEIIKTGVAETFEESFSSSTGLLTTRLTTKLPWRNATGDTIGIIGIARDISDRLQAETALRESEAQLRQDIVERRQAEELLQQQSQRERLIASIVQQIRQSLHLNTILSTTVDNIRHCLKSDRVTIYRLDGRFRGRFVAESVAAPWPALLHTVMRQAWLRHYLDHYQQGLVSVLTDLQQAEFSPGMLRFLQRSQVQAGLAVPILQGQQLWGLLIVHQCTAPRIWDSSEIDLLQQLAAQVAIAIQQSELFQQVQQLNTVLEDQVQERTTQLQQALIFEAMLKRITDKVRDSLDEAHILTTAVQELALGLGVTCCDTGIYNLEHHTSTISYEYSTESSAVGHTVSMAERSEVYHQLLQGQYLQFCIFEGFKVRSIQKSATMLACPILDDQGALGDLWLFRPNNSIFNELEIRLVQQVANQCAIAIRQARLYQASQAQIAELEKLNHLKDDFLSTVSHELRTPMSSIKMATQMLEFVLHQEGILNNPDSRAPQYFQILHDECQREIKLINDLLDLARLDADTEPLLLSTIDPQCWIPSIAEPFLERSRLQSQQLQVHLPENLPTLHTDLSVLERIVTELLNNACKYTPVHEQIIVSAEATPDSFLLSVTNSGVAIAASELTHIFDKFYRIPNNDPWKHGGTGLGLALVQKLVEHLSGTIQVNSQGNQVSFIVRLPIAPNTST